MGHLLGYARVSTADQSPDLQLDALHAAGCYRIFADRPAALSMTAKSLPRFSTSCGQPTRSWFGNWTDLDVRCAI